MRFDPSASRYPIAGLCLIDARFHFGEKIFEAGGAFEIESHLTRWPTPERCWCESVKPGRTVLPLRSTTRVFGPTYFCAAAFVPTKTILSSLTAIACALGDLSFAV